MTILNATLTDVSSTGASWSNLTTTRLAANDSSYASGLFGVAGVSTVTFEFDLSSIPDNAVVSSWSLTIRAAGASHGFDDWSINIDSGIGSSGGNASNIAFNDDFSNYTETSTAEVSGATLKSAVFDAEFAMDSDFYSHTIYIESALLSVTYTVPGTSSFFSVNF